MVELIREVAVMLMTIVVVSITARTTLARLLIIVTTRTTLTVALTPVLATRTARTLLIAFRLVNEHTM